jgi:hypothetical protein
LDELLDLLLVDHLLHRPEGDPYLFAEASIAANDFFYSEPLVELRCRVFAEPQYLEMCDTARRILASSRAAGEERDTDGQLRFGLESLALPGLAEIRQRLSAELAAVPVAHSAAPAPAQQSPRRSVIPAPSPFAELPLPPEFRGTVQRPSRPPRGMAALPEGFIPIRVERDGGRAVAISVSQTYDPTGEVSSGGYWVHRSRDGGRTWDQPLYTGLAHRFPYVVAPASRMPMLDGEALNVEVEIAEIDTASITYPPVALQTRRRARDLYLRIPLADLVRDADGDGITDIAERKLLLDRARSDGGTPFVVGSDRGTNCGAPTAERLALTGRSRGCSAAAAPMRSSSRSTALPTIRSCSAAGAKRPRRTMRLSSSVETREIISAYDRTA